MYLHARPQSCAAAQVEGDTRLHCITKHNVAHSAKHKVKGGDYYHSEEHHQLGLLGRLHLVLQGQDLGKRGRECEIKDAFAARLCEPRKKLMRCPDITKCYMYS